MADLNGGRGWLSDAAAASIHRIDRQLGRLLDINEAGRTWAQQNEHWLRYQRYLNGGPWAPIALRPGTSIHESGNAVDTDDRLISVMNANGWKQTVYRNGVLVEPWHFEYDASRDQHSNDSVADVAAGQRTGGPDGVKRRVSPDTKTAPLEDGLTPGEVGNFNGWIRGENVNGNDIWVRGISGNFFWSGGLVEGANLAGLEDLNPVVPPALGPQQRQVRPDDIVKRRIGASSQTAEAGDPLAPGEIGNFTGWINGESVNGNPVWIRGVSGHYFWSGGFTDTGTHDLADLNGSTPPVVSAPGNVLDPAAPWKNQTPDSELATWVGSPNYNNSETGLGAKLKTGITQHWFGTSSTLSGTDDHFQNPGKEIRNGRGTGASSQYGIGADGTTHQYVKEADYAHTNGTYEGNATRITIEHECGPGKPATEALIEASAKLHADIATRHGWAEFVWMENADPHKKWVQTECPGTLPSAEILRRANLILRPPYKPDSPVVTPPVPDTVPVDRNLLQSWFDKLKALLGK